MYNRLRSLRFALQGLQHLVRTERSARWHLLATTVALVLGLLLRLTLDQWRWILLATALLWAGEAFNTALERLGDAVTLEQHPDVGRAKDVAAAAVLICALAAALIALSVLVPAIVLQATR